MTLPLLRHRAAWIALICAAELLCLAALYQFAVDLACHETAWNGLCRGLRGLAARGFATLAVAVLMVWAWPRATRRFLDQSDAAAPVQGAVALHLAGVVLLALPGLAAALPDGLNLGARFGSVALVLGLGALMAAVGAARWIAPWHVWAGFLTQDRGAPLWVLLAGALIPDLADLVLPLWDTQALAALTFEAVHAYLSLFGAEVVSDPHAYVIGLAEFRVHIARQCSGVEGVALVSAFVVLYGLLFRRDLYLWRYGLTVLPIAILTSWGLNALRIGILIQIGDALSPELAVNGFHSYAGWLFFTVLSLTVIWVVHSTGWLHRAPVAAPGSTVPLSRDPAAALTLPLAVMLIVTVLQHALFPHPELGYPIKAIAMALAVGFFWRVIAGWGWRVDGLSLAVGVAVGVGWLALDRNTTGDSALVALLTEMTAASLWSWVAFRMLGTVVLVPIIEEAFFRGFLLGRVAPMSGLWLALAVLGSSLLFGLLHGRWIAGTVAGLVLALVYLRRRSLSDAAQAHIAANLVVALWAAAQGDWSRI